MALSLFGTKPSSSPSVRDDNRIRSLGEPYLTSRREAPEWRPVIDDAVVVSVAAYIRGADSPPEQDEASSPNTSVGTNVQRALATVTNYTGAISGAVDNLSAILSRLDALARRSENQLLRWDIAEERAAEAQALIEEAERVTTTSDYNGRSLLELSSLDFDIALTGFPERSNRKLTVVVPEGMIPLAELGLAELHGNSFVTENAIKTTRSALTVATQMLGNIQGNVASIDTAVSAVQREFERALRVAEDSDSAPSPTAHSSREMLLSVAQSARRALTGHAESLIELISEPPETRAPDDQVETARRDTLRLLTLPGAQQGISAFSSRIDTGRLGSFSTIA